MFQKDYKMYDLISLITSCIYCSQIDALHAKMPTDHSL